MPFEKGSNGGSAGRPKGSLNKTTAALKEAMTKLIEDEFDAGRVKDALMRLYDTDPKAYADVIAAFAGKVMPKDMKVEITRYDLTVLTDEQLYMLSEITAKMEHS